MDNINLFDIFLFREDAFRILGRRFLEECFLVSSIDGKEKTIDLA
jgi:hypothetical protein